MDEAVADNRKDWVAPELIVEDVKTVTRGGGTEPIIGVEDVEAAYYTSV